MASADTSPSLERLLFDFAEAVLGDVWTGQPGRVERYDADKRRADVQPLVQRRYIDEEGNVVAETLPVVTDVPVVWAGGGGFGLTFPLAAGDVVWLAHAAASIDRWAARGGVVDPEDGRRHALTDAVAFAGLQDFAHATSAPADRVRLGKAGVALEVTSSEVLVGGGAGHEPTVKYTTRNTAEQTFLAALGAYLATLGTATGLSGPAGTFATALSNFIAALPASATAIAKVK